MEEERKKKTDLKMKMMRTILYFSFLFTLGIPKVLGFSIAESALFIAFAGAICWLISYKVLPKIVRTDSGATTHPNDNQSLGNPASDKKARKRLPIISVLLTIAIILLVVLHNENVSLKRLLALNQDWYVQYSDLQTCILEYENYVSQIDKNPTISIKTPDGAPPMILTKDDVLSAIVADPSNMETYKILLSELDKKANMPSGAAWPTDYCPQFFDK